MSPAAKNTFSARATLKTANESYEIYRLEALERAGVGKVSRLPFSLKVLLENLLRQEDNQFVHAEDIRALASWDLSAAPATEKEISFMPARVLLQDFTGRSGGGGPGRDA
jgi:aconitate hydratase